jgi:hypothetical protein
MPTFLRNVFRGLAAVAALVTVLSVAPARATTGLLILEGSDAQTFHQLNPYSTDFLNGLATYSASPTLPIGYFNYNPVGTPTVGKVALTLGALPDLATLLASYSGLYIGSPGSCCSQSSLSLADATEIAAFLAADHSVAIEDYQGGAQFDLIVGTSGGANAYVAGLGGGASGLGSCFDGNKVAAGGSAYGLGAIGAAVPNIGCFGHQAYNSTFFDALGLSTYIVASPGLTDYNVVISNGGGGLQQAVTEAAPEPMSIALLGAGLVSLGVIRRRRR